MRCRLRPTAPCRGYVCVKAAVCVGAWLKLGISALEVPRTGGGGNPNTFRGRSCRSPVRVPEWNSGSPVAICVCDRAAIKPFWCFLGGSYPQRPAPGFCTLMPSCSMRGNGCWALERVCCGPTCVTLVSSTHEPLQALFQRTRVRTCESHKDTRVHPRQHIPGTT